MFEPSDGGIPSEYFLELGRLAVVSSTLDHTATALLHFLERRREYKRVSGRKELDKRLRKALHDREREGAITSELATFCRGWVARALDLLDRRDIAIHAIWSVDPATDEVFMSHMRGLPPDLDELRALVLESRTHMGEWTYDRQVPIHRLLET